MKLVLLLIVGCVALGSLGWWGWRRWRTREAPMVSLVLLLKEPAAIDLTVLAKTAGRVWHADLGDGAAEGTDGFVVNVGTITTIKHGERLFVMHNFPMPYAEDPDEVAAEIPDMRVARLFREHRAWFSCDCLSAEPSTSTHETAELYRRIGTLLANFVDENCLLVFVPETRRAYPVNDKTIGALESDDPLAALQATTPAPVVRVSDDDPEMQAATLEARTTWPRFVAAFAEQRGANFAAKAPISNGENTEYIWVDVTAIEGDRVRGTLGNEPADLAPLELGSQVSFSLADLSDWAYFDEAGQMQGGFTTKVLMKAANWE